MSEPSIQNIPTKKLIGINIQTSLSEFNPSVVWQKFIPRLKEIENKVGSEKYSIQVYEQPFSYDSFNPNMKFEYWAAIEVNDINTIPDDMFSLEIPSGKYAVFLHKGNMSAFQKTLSYIYTKWLPSSGFIIDHRPYFERLDERYLGANNPDSQEEVWVPIK
jgi:AraC family transcriptional regulator